MTEVGNDLEIIKIYWEGKTYQIKAEKVKDSDKQDIEKVYASDSHDANKILFGKCEYSIDLSGVQSHRWLFNWIRERQRNGYFKGYPSLSTYYYNTDGKAVVHNVYVGVFVEEISGENQDPFDVKMIALKRNIRNAKNEFYR